MVRKLPSRAVWAGLGVGLCSLFLSSPAKAEGEVASITFSPLHLLFPMFEAQAEFRVVPAFGVAVIGGVGSKTVDHIHFGFQELGGQLVAYPLADFRSLQLGGEFIYIHVSGERDDVTGAASGFSVGPFVGFKLITKVGFTFFVQGGAQYFHAEAHAENSEGDSASQSASAWGPLLNLNIGWSF